MGSLVSDAATDYIRRSANIPQYTAASIMGWYQPASGIKAAAASVTIAKLGASGGSAVVVRASGYFGYETMSGSEANLLVDTSWSEESWYCFAISHSSAPQQKIYVWNSSGTLLGSLTRADAQTPTWSVIEVAANGNGGNSAKGKYAYWKVWEHTLNQAEFEAELFSPTFLTAPDYYADANTGFADSATDIGPNGRNWTLAAGVTTDSDTPPVVVGLAPIVLTWTM
jgi:hypothetical protein